MPWLVAGFLVIGGLTYIAYLGVNRNNPPAVARMANAGTRHRGRRSGWWRGGGGRARRHPPGHQTMSATERFDRLFNRIMRAAAAGDTAQSRQFTPMATRRIRQLDTVTADARYHAAVLYAESGQMPAALALADTILAENPDHLFGYVVRGEVADRRHDAAAAAAARRDFHGPLPGRDRPADRPEYGEHKPVIDEFRNSVNSQR